MPKSQGSRGERRGDGRRHGWVHIASILLIPLGIALVVAGCGSSGKSSRGSGGHLTLAQAQQDAVRYSDCMRSHGVSGFPDPTSTGGGIKIAITPSSGVDPQSPTFHSAQAACRHLLPDGGPRNQTATRSQSQIAALLAFARCMRSHGFPSFPDPTSTGQLTHEMLAQAGINLQQPAVVRAADACVGVTHGLITKLDVARFIAGQ
jgi:hypothetical protein